MFEAEVARGAAWLDEHKPGWERLIDVGTLDLEKCEVCVLGQVFMAEHGDNGFTYGMRLVFGEMDQRDDWREVADAFSGREDREWGALTDAWGRLLKERFDTGALSDAGL